MTTWRKGIKNVQNLRDVIYGRPLNSLRLGISNRNQNTLVSNVLFVKLRNLFGRFVHRVRQVDEDEGNTESCAGNKFIIISIR